ncbi:hypothetical protein RCH21_002062 [Arthrobacter sp. PL16]|uniref:hypothetical protein n=1 Tax=Arthrobacter sp. PL16 TaxID=3071720 RepID=UPI002DFE5F1A|nr:hypothetical protein [Arthrobacter sp. PL16]
MRAIQPPSRFSIYRQVLLGAVTLSMLLSGCAGAPGSDTSSTEAAEVVESYDCLAPNLGEWAQPPDEMSSPNPQHLNAPDAGRVPVGFTPAVAVRCDQMGSIDDAEGRWSGVTAVTLTGDLKPLLAALAEPNDAIEGGPCTADMEIVSPLWLVDATGQAILAHYPRNKCAKTKPAVHDALAELSVEKTTVLKRTLDVPRAALDSGCAATRALPVKQGTSQSIPSTDSSSGVIGALPAPPAPLPDSVLTDTVEMRWCRYTIQAATPEVAEQEETETFTGVITLRSGRFVTGGTLDEANSQMVVDAALSTPVAPSCDESATMFLTLSPSQDGHELGTITVELDGCGLLYRNGSETGTLPADVRNMLTTQTGI